MFVPSSLGHTFLSQHPTSLSRPKFTNVVATFAVECGGIQVSLGARTWSVVKLLCCCCGVGPGLEGV